MLTSTALSVPAVIARELQHNHLLLELADQELLNINALARQLKVIVDHELQQRVPETTIAMAIRRHLDSLEPVPRAQAFPKHIDITTKSGMYEVSFASTEKNRKLAADIRASVLDQDGEALSVIVGAYEVVLYASKRSASKVKRLLKQTRKNSELDDLACVTVDWPPSTKDIPGIYFRVTRALYFANVSIQSFHTIGAEMTIFVKEPALERAHAAISRVLGNLG